MFQPQLLKGDCFALLKDIPDASIDMICTDPPYGTVSCKWDVVIPFAPMWEQLKRIRKPNSCVALFGSEPFSSALRISNIDEYKYDWVWKKTKAGNFIQANYQPIKYHEIISVFSDAPASYTKTGKRMKYYPQMWGSTTAKNKGQSIQTAVAANRGKFSDSYRLKSTNESGRRFPISILEYPNLDKMHPTQKPVALLEYLIKTYTLEGEIVLDFTMGSGSTGVACLNTNRNFIGIEKDEGYFDMARSRMEARMGELNGQEFFMQ
jgi:site-specific DNA-methyltransferase (adenine-specific)